MLQSQKESQAIILLQQKQHPKEISLSQMLRSRKQSKTIILLQQKQHPKEMSLIEMIQAKKKKNKQKVTECKDGNQMADGLEVSEGNSFPNKDI